MIMGCATRVPHATTETYIPREAIVSVGLTDKTECTSDPLKHVWNCTNLKMEFVKGSERVRVKGKRFQCNNKCDVDQECAEACWKRQYCPHGLDHGKK